MGNPPFNDKNESPIYNIFIEYSLKICKKNLLFIIPSRWFSGGKGLDKFRKMMLNRKDIELIKHIENSSNIFGKNVLINGGVNYFLINKNYKGLCNFNGNMIQLNKYDILINNILYYSIIDKIIQYKSIDIIYKGRYYGIETNDNNLVSKKINDNYIKCFYQIIMEKLNILIKNI